jgi:hypothetical protein
MTANRLLYVGIALVLAIIAVLNFVNIRATTALSRADRAYDQIERARAQRWYSDQTADRSYDVIENQRLHAAVPMVDHSNEEVERVRAQRSVPPADRSYDQIESLRLMRTWPH